MSRRSRLRRMLLVGVPQLLAVVPAATAMLAEWHRLPERVATRFAFDGSVTDHMSRPALLVSMIALALVLAVTFGLVHGPPSGARPVLVSTWDLSRLLVVTSWALAGFLGVLLFMVVTSNVDARAAAEVSMPPVAPLYALGAAVVTGAIGSVLAPKSRARPLDDQEPPAMAIGAGEHVSWSRSISSPWLAVLGAVLVVVGPVLGWSVGWAGGGPVVASGLLVALMSRAMVTADRRGLTVTFTALGWPRLRIGLDKIESATAEDVSPAQFGGWGYRIVPGASGVVLRSGLALIITRTSGRRFVVTVDDAETAARVLNGLRTRKA